MSLQIAPEIEAKVREEAAARGVSVETVINDALRLLRKHRPGLKWSAVVLLCALGAPLGLASDILVWFVAAFMAFAVRLSKRWVWIYATAGVVTAAAK